MQSILTVIKKIILVFAPINNLKCLYGNLRHIYEQHGTPPPVWLAPVWLALVSWLARP